MTNKKAKERLEYLRKQIQSECISYGEIVELQSLAKYIDKDDVELLEPAGVPEFEVDKEQILGNIIDIVEDGLVTGEDIRTMQKIVELLNENKLLEN